MKLKIEARTFEGSATVPPSIKVEVDLWAPDNTYRGKVESLVEGASLLALIRALPREVTEVNSGQTDVLEALKIELERLSGLAEGRVDKLLAAISVQRDAARELASAEAA
jgi:hypothetical protein